MNIAIILGTRPEIIKMSPIIRECKRKKIDFFILHTNQHYSKSLDRIFFNELELPRAKYNLDIGSGTQAEELGRMLISIEKVLIKERPDIILVEGDTNTVLAGALAAVKLHIKVGHIEAGLRSYFREMPEEINRILTDHCSDFLFAPTKMAKEILTNEGICKGKIFITGNTIVDAVHQNLKKGQNKSKILKELGLRKNEYLLATIHRPENVDKKQRLKNILKGLELVYKKFKLPVVFSIHPRTEKMISKFELKIPKGINLIKPIGFLDFLQLEKDAKLVLTDSGGVQEETCILRIPCVTLSANSQKILNCVSKMLNRKRNWGNPFGNGKAAKKIIEIINKIE